MKRSLVGIAALSLTFLVFPLMVPLAGPGGLLGFLFEKIEPSLDLARSLWAAGAVLFLLALLVLARLAPRQHENYRTLLKEQSKRKVGRR